MGESSHVKKAGQRLDTGQHDACLNKHLIRCRWR